MAFERFKVLLQDVAGLTGIDNLTEKLREGTANAIEKTFELGQEISDKETKALFIMEMESHIKEIGESWLESMKELYYECESELHKDAYREVLARHGVFVEDETPNAYDDNVIS